MPPWLEETAENLYAVSNKSPKSVVLPVVEIVRNSITFCTELTWPPAIIPLVWLDWPAFSWAPFNKSPKSVALPVEAIVI